MEAANQAGQAGQQGAEAAQQGAEADGQVTQQGGEVRATAAARRMAEEMNVDLTEVEGTGQDGRITVDDVRGSAQEG